MSDNEITPDCTFCADASVAVGEQLYATAPRGDVWLLLEYTGSWGAKVLPDSDLAQPIKDRLNAWSAAIPNSKLLFIRQARDIGDTLSLYVAISDELNPTLYHLRLSNYDDLIGLDLEAIANRDPRFNPYRVDELLYLVCVNGRRDVSCAKYGVPLFKAVAEQVGESAWQSSHPGGHRFAGNLVCLPSGTCYGRLYGDEAAEIIKAERRGELALHNLRGRSCYDAPVQAADYYLRAAEGLVERAGLRLLDVSADGDAHWVVRFDAPQQARQYEVRVRRFLPGWVTCENSGETVLKPIPQFRLEGYRVMERE